MQCVEWVGKWRGQGDEDRAVQMRKTGRQGHQMEQQMAVAVKTTRGWAEVSLCPSWCVKKRGTRRQVSYTSVLPDVPGAHTTFDVCVC